MILKLLAIVAIVIAAILIFAAVKPRTFQIRRSIEVGAPSEKVFALINDLHQWPRWAPQDREDPTMRRTFSGSPSGQGAVSEWSSTGSAGRGRMSIAESVPASMVLIEVDFIKPFKAHNLNQFTLERAANGGTKVIWSMHGPNLYVMRLMGLFINMDSMMGRHFESGLSNLKTAAEE